MTQAKQVLEDDGQRYYVVGPADFIHPTFEVIQVAGRHAGERFFLPAPLAALMEVVRTCPSPIRSR